jgi:light-regulated signal transduction histidine kinase (bacteriophytochrome)
VAAVREAIAEGREVRITLLNYRKDGTPFWNDLAISPVRDAEGRITHFIGIQFDVSNHIRDRENLRQLNEHMEERVRERTAQMTAANSELEAFSYSVSHDLRAPLRHISGFTEMLQKRSGDSLDDTGRHYLTTIAQAAKHAGTLVDDLLAFARTGRAEFQRRAVDMNDLIRDTIAVIESEIKGNAAQNRKPLTPIEWHIEEVPPAHVDAALMRQVWHNLISNAVKYSRPRAARDETTSIIEIGARQTDGEVTYFVRDNGVGFDPRYIDKLFGVFQRMHVSSEFEGTGIGLALVKRIVDRHGGQVGAKGEVDKGAEFWFTLPGTNNAVNKNGTK